MNNRREKDLFAIIFERIRASLKIDREGEGLRVNFGKEEGLKCK